ncbi:MAG: hypothetical protein WCJ25_03670 [Candidatus Moraniibacteriota bacterium]
MWKEQVQRQGSEPTRVETAKVLPVPGKKKIVVPKWEGENIRSPRAEKSLPAGQDTNFQQAVPEPGPARQKQAEEKLVEQESAQPGRVRRRSEKQAQTCDSDWGWEPDWERKNHIRPNETSASPLKNPLPEEAVGDGCRYRQCPHTGWRDEKTGPAIRRRTGFRQREIRPTRKHGTVPESDGLLAPKQPD